MAIFNLPGVFNVFVSLCIAAKTQAMCPSGWFGPNCQYMCHCDSVSSCDITGHCLGKCGKEWFGTGCQYQDLATVQGVKITPTPGQATNWLTDRDLTTCNGDSKLSALQISWDKDYPFTWLRLDIKESALRLDFSINFISARAETLTCMRQQMAVVDETTVDFRCDLNETIAKVTVTGKGLQALCSIYINGGRNVALKQTSEQSSTYSGTPVITNAASNSVDGNTESNYGQGSCATAGDDHDRHPSWTLTLDTAKVVNRIIIYNRADCCLERLKNVRLESLDANNRTLWTYTDKNPNAVLIYTVTRLQKDNISTIRISSTHTRPEDPKMYLTLCEVLLYGDCVPGHWGLECKLACPAECPTWCQPDTGTCLFCLGYSDPPLCNTACVEGKFGLNCQSPCDSKCYNTSCDQVTGVCNKGCLGYSDPPHCIERCVAGKWGQNCQHSCKSSCHKNSCDRVSGACDSGCNGYMDPPKCVMGCQTGRWGRNCANICSANCKEPFCDRVTGLCDLKCDSSKDLSCPADCQAGFHGSDCSLQCSAACESMLCNRLGYCISCLPGYTGRYCEIDSSGRTFPSGVGVGLSVCGIVVIFIVLLVAVIKRGRSTKGNNTLKKGTKPDTYDGVNNELEDTLSHKES